MSVDPTDPDTFDVNDQDASLDEEVPEADAAEQHADVLPEDDDHVNGADLDAANEADAAEQARVVALDEDDYR
ncbi:MULTISPECIES: hypothetical protein [unclassified Streptomyces]|uniref:hypothetical protein n=1 Tax=unclassified Streptomyces TaxID=2593676 RepID=UPI002DDBF433|nr:hypothetical protein [Streptomyces sp. NBC_01750]WSB00471.1 hypothetical protein OIE54_14870 [Streptomyces sp. NBC_01794]WSD35171.1 hypothetical protein OG966_26740 [Streptomyces sp. NBC_01750]